MSARGARLSVWAVLALVIVCGSARAATLPVDLATLRLGPGDEGVVRVNPEGRDLCVLGFRLTAVRRPSGTSAAQGPFVARIGGPRLEWRWRVPADVSPGPWTATVECREISGSRRGQAILDIDVVGAPTGSAPLVLAGSLQTSVEPAQGRSSLDQAIRLAQVVAPLVAIIGLLFVGLQLAATRRQARDARTADYLRRYEDRSFTQSAGRARGFLETDSDDPNAEQVGKAKILKDAAALGPTAGLLPTRWPADKAVPFASRADVSEYLAFFEELGGAYNTGLLDKRLVIRLLGHAAYKGFVSASWYLRSRLREGEELVEVTRAYKLVERSWSHKPFRWRRRERSSTYEEWGQMCRDIYRIRPDVAKTV